MSTPPRAAAALGGVDPPSGHKRPTAAMAPRGDRETVHLSTYRKHWLAWYPCLDRGTEYGSERAVQNAWNMVRESDPG